MVNLSMFAQSSVVLLKWDKEVLKEVIKEFVVAVITIDVIIEQKILAR